MREEKLKILDKLFGDLSELPRKDGIREGKLLIGWGDGPVYSRNLQRIEKQLKDTRKAAQAVVDMFSKHVKYIDEYFTTPPPVLTEWTPYHATFSGIDLETPFLEGDKGDDQ